MYNTKRNSVASNAIGIRTCANKLQNLYNFVVDLLQF